MPKNKIMNKWKTILESQDLPSIATASREELVAQILEAQEADIANNVEGVYSDDFIVSQLKHLGGELTEAVVAGDHSYTPANIAAGTNSGAAVGIGPTVMGMVRRAIPNMIAFDVCGVQPMTQSTGQVFTFNAMYGKDFNGKAAFHPIAGVDANFSGRSTGLEGAGLSSKVAFVELKAAADAPTVATTTTVFYNFLDGKIAHLFNPTSGTVTFTTTGTTKANKIDFEAELIGFMQAGKLVEIAEGMATSYAELCEGFNGSTNNPWNEMSFRIDKYTVEAKSRQLKAQYSIELAQDLKAVHGINADTELSTILATEIMLETNREIIMWINATAQIGKTGWTNKHGGKAGVFDFKNANDTRGARWAGESYKSLIIQIDKEATEIARQTGRGAGNFIIASRNVVAAFGHTDMFISAAVQGTTTGFNTNPYNSTFAGVLAGKYRVYIDQYAHDDYFTVGYKGASEMDAGIYYCPYVPLTPLRGVDPKNFQPVMGFKTRYAVGINPFADSSKISGFAQLNDGMPGKDMFGKNCYFRKVSVIGL